MKSAVAAPLIETGDDRSKVLVPDEVDIKVQVETPDASELEHDPVVFPVPPLTEKVGVYPDIGKFE